MENTKFGKQYPLKKGARVYMYASVSENAQIEIDGWRQKEKETDRKTDKERQRLKQRDTDRNRGEEGEERL